MRPPWLVLAPLLVLFAGACGGDRCERSGCEAVARPASPSIRQGVAGVGASESDAGYDGCFPCSFTNTTWRLWRAPSRIADDASAAALTRTDAMATIMADPRYERALEPGEYLLCLVADDLTCAAASVTAGRVATVNARLVDGPPQLVIFEGGARRDSGVFRLAR